MLFRADLNLGVCCNPSSFPRRADYDGLDATAALPPLLRPDMLMDLDAYDVWERHAVAVFADDAETADSAMARLAAGVERIRAWRPGRTSLTDAISVMDFEMRARPRSDTRSSSLYAAVDGRTVLSCAPRDLVPPSFESRTGAATAAGQIALPRDLDRALRRYLAAKLFGSWLAYQGRGLRTIVGSLYAALDVVRLEAARQCDKTGRPLDQALLVEAIRQADLLLVHKVSSRQLARRLSRLESATDPN
jgi:hypothetical protein